MYIHGTRRCAGSASRGAAEAAKAAPRNPRRVMIDTSFMVFPLGYQDSSDECSAGRKRGPAELRTESSDPTSAPSSLTAACALAPSDHESHPRAAHLV